MQTGPNRIRLEQVRWALAGLASLAYVLALGLQRPNLAADLGLLLLAALLVAFLINVPVLFNRGGSNLAHFIGLSLSFVHPGAATASAMLLGILAGGLVRARWTRSPGHSPLAADRRASAVAMDWAQQGLSALSGWAAYQLLSRVSVAGGLSGASAALPVAGLVFAFVGVHTVLLLLDVGLQSQAGNATVISNRLALLTIEVLAIPFAALAAATGMQTGTLAVLGGLLAVVAVIVNRLGHASQRLEKKLGELTTLTRVSQAMRTSLDMESLLEAIQLQVTQALGVRNFYVGLHNPDDNSLHYPIAYRDGARQTWAPRPIGHRLTDRVILSGEPVLLSNIQPGTLLRMNLDEGGTPILAWLGVPLLAADRVLGCLAIFTTEPTEGFGPDDLTMLTIIAAQASVGIENAQLIGEMRRKAEELRTLNDLSALVSASLDPERVLELVCISVIRVVGCQKSAIFLVDPERRDLRLARAEGLSSTFREASRSLSPEDPERAGCLISGAPVVVPDVAGAALPESLQTLLSSEGVRAYADVPLQAGDEHIGFLSVYFSDAHTFRQSELELLSTFAAHVALAVSNARLYARTDQALARRVTQLSALDAIGRELTSTLELDHLFDIMLERAMTATGAVRGSVALYDEEQERLNTVATRGAPAGINGTARSKLSVPILHEGQSQGAISLESDQAGTFSDEDLEFVTRLAIQAAIAIENGQLFERVREGRDRLAAVLNSTREGVLMIDREGRIVLVNPQVETLWGLSPDWLVGQHLTQLLGDSQLRIPDKLGVTAEALRTMVMELQGGTLGASRATVRMLEPRARILERTGTPVQDDADRVIGWLVVLRDVTEEKELEETRSQLTNMIVHDLRSPLNAVVGGLSIATELLKPETVPDLVRQALEVSFRACKRLLNLVDSMLDIARLEAGEMKLKSTPLALHRVVGDVLQDMVALANDQGVMLLNAIPDDLPQVLGDEDKVGRILLNLVDNALKFSPTGGKVVVTSQPNGAQETIVQVMDEGPGIPDDYRERIFDRFVQVKDQVGRRRGTGLGLAFCKLAVEAHGGRIWVENRPGGGSAFNFSLRTAALHPAG